MKIRPRFQLTQLTTANPLPYTYALLADHAGRNSGKARQMGEAMSYTVSRLDWTDASLGVIATPRGQLALRASFGSGLATRDGDPPGRVWAVCDRGPNLKVTIAIERYGLDVLTPLADVSGAKIMPDPTIGPAIAELQIDDDTVTLLRTIRLVDEIGSPVMGLPDASSEHVVLEPVFDIQGKPIGPSCLGLDSEVIVALASGGFWIGDEFAPALVRVDDKGQIVQRLVPQQIDHGGGEEVHAGLPAIAARRQINRGFEALSLSGDERSLFLAFQSPLAHPTRTRTAGRAMSACGAWIPERVSSPSNTCTRLIAQELSYVTECSGRSDARTSRSARSRGFQVTASSCWSADRLRPNCTASTWTRNPFFSQSTSTYAQGLRLKR